jgi:hypothetical protein
MILYHYTKLANKDNIVKYGLKAFSKYEVLSPVRENVVYCWISPTDNKIVQDDQICVKINVSDDRCYVAEMDYISMAIMYKNGEMNKPKNNEVANLFIQIYELTAIPLRSYKDKVFFTPEVLVKGDILPYDIEFLKLNQF